MSKSLPLRVVIDGRPLVGRRTGIGVHAAEIASRLGVTPSPLIASHAEIDDKRGIESCRFDVRDARSGVTWQQLELPRVARDDESDVLWGPHGTLPLRRGLPAVSSIHDLSSITHPGGHRLKTILSFNVFIGRSLAQASEIAAVSRRTAEDLMRGFAVDPRRITVVPNGVDPFFSPQQGAEGLRGQGAEGGPWPPGSSGPGPLTSSSPYILYVGTFEPRKGIPDLLHAWLSLPASRPMLVMCGDTGWGRIKGLDRLRSEHPRDIVVLDFVDRPTLRELYRQALVFVYPSRHEGFGLPPLEAMACGTPVLSTATGAIDDYLGEGGIVVAPGDRGALARQLRRLCESFALRRELREGGVGRAEGYRWERGAGLMTELLARAAGGSSL